MPISSLDSRRVSCNSPKRSLSPYHSIHLILSPQPMAKLTMSKVSCSNMPSKLAQSVVISIPQILPIRQIAHAVAHYHALTRHIHEAQHEPLRSFGRNSLILPLAYALAHNRAHVTNLMTNHASAELTDYLTQTGIFDTCQAQLEQACQRAKSVLDTLQPGIGRDMLSTLL